MMSCAKPLPIIEITCAFVEDSPTTLDDLRTYGYSDEVVEAVGLLT